MSTTQPGDVLDEIKIMKNRMEALYTECFAIQEPGGAAEGSVGSGREAKWNPQVDILETDKEWVAVADLPGVTEEDLKVHVEQGALVMEGERAETPNGQKFRRSLAERPLGYFSRSFVLPPNLQVEDTIAELKQGVLTVIIPKKDSARRVEVRYE